MKHIKRTIALALFAAAAFSGANHSIRTGYAQQEAGDTHDEDSQGEARGGTGGRRGGRSMRGQNPMMIASAKFDGKEAKITYGKVSTKSKDYQQIETMKPGSVLKFFTFPAIKVRTSANLKFGDKTIRAGNIAKDYPGIYSLWLKKGEKDWRVVFSKDGDVWGTMYDPKQDEAEIPLTAAKLAEAVAEFTLELKAEGNKGTLRIAWGNDEWTAKFDAIE